LPDEYGDVIDADTIEAAAKATLKAWLSAHLAIQERRKGLDACSVTRPRSWPTVSEFDPEPHEQLPSVVIVSTGTTGAPVPDGQGRYSATWRLEIAVAVAGAKEDDARRLASMYVAAVRSALVQNQSLGGIASATRWVGDEYAIGTTQRGARAIYGANFDIDVDDVVNAQLGPAEPPPDPCAPPGERAFFDTAQIDATSEGLDEELTP
jgi:hypothetical protein